MSTGQPGFTSPKQDSCTPFSFEESSTSPLMENIDKDGIDVEDISDDERNNGNYEGNNENIGNEKNDTQNEDVDPHKHAFQRKPRKRTSTIWNDFEEVVDIDGSKKICPHIMHYGKVDSTTNSLKFPLSRPCNVGEPCYLSYGNLSSSCMVTFYGFLPQGENPCDVIPLAVRHRVATEAFISKLFATISSVKAAYAQLQSAQSPYDVDGIQSTDQVMVSEMKSLSELKQCYLKKQHDESSLEITQLLAETQE
ncbi:hypothetical protein F0562_032830 [Nyssa sinensis]|uniref:DUF641 domain-containing protein n=1 Tax=Nyssa sinensis TaxID=561372 RepID=A0A5J5ATQ9_9ASTE|nr:hypothetical protein F0562_032830 [Nyssa sinensis]